MKAVLHIIHELEDAELDLTEEQILTQLDVELGFTNSEVEDCLRYSLEEKLIVCGETSSLDGSVFMVRRLTLRGREFLFKS